MNENKISTAYPSIGHLSTSKFGKDKCINIDLERKLIGETPLQPNEKVYILEKYDGTNVSVIRKNGNLIALQRHGYLCKSSKFQEHHDFDAWLQNNKERFEFLQENDRVFFEWLGTTYKLSYDIKYSFPLIVIDAKINGVRVSFLELEKITALKLRAAIPLIASLSPDTPQNRFEWLKKHNDCLFYTPNPEGLVYRFERNGKFESIAKWVRPDF